MSGFRYYDNGVSKVVTIVDVVRRSCFPGQNFGRYRTTERAKSRAVNREWRLDAASKSQISQACYDCHSSHLSKKRIHLEVVEVEV